MFTDHIDRNRLNNTKGNLRTANATQNMMNTSIRKGKVSKYKGVWWNNTAHFWFSGITINKETIHLGCFRTQSEAAIAYNEAAIKYFGEFANLNDVLDRDPNDSPVMKRRPRRGGLSQYAGVIPHCGSYAAYHANNGKKHHIGAFPNEKFAARIYDAYAVIRFGDDAIRHVNFTKSIDSPLSLDARYVFKSVPKRSSLYLGVARQNSAWAMSFSANGERSRSIFHSPIEAAEHWDKLTLIHRDNICTYLNFPENLDRYLAEIGDQIVSPKPIIIPDLDW